MDETVAREPPPTMNGETVARPGILPAILLQGFRVALVYCTGGVILEALGPRLPGSAYPRLAAVFYGLPGAVLRRTGAQAVLSQGVMEARIPPWLAAAAYPATGVALILALALALGLAASFVRLLFSLRTR